MSMVVIERAPKGNPGLGAALEPPISKTMVWPPNRQRIAAAKAGAGGWANAQRAAQGNPGFGANRFDPGLGRYGMRGLGAGDGFMSGVPEWAWWLGGGLAAGILTAYVVSK